MDNLKEMMKQEAIRRMEALKIMPDVIRKFKDDNEIYYSERLSQICGGILFNFKGHPDWLNKIEKFEKKNGYLVYHAVLTHFNFGDVLDLLFVNDQDDEWEYELSELKQGYADIYAINISEETLSELGSAMYEPLNGGVNKLK